MIIELEVQGKPVRANITQRDGRYWVQIANGAEFAVDASFPQPGVVQFLLDGRSHTFHFAGSNGDLKLVSGGATLEVSVRDPRSLRSRRGGAAGDSGPRKITAPMPGKVVRVLANEGDEVEVGDGVIVIEAMKMQNELKAPKAGRVQKIAALEGATVNPGDALVIIE